jgi:hypothetical protein
LASLQPFNPEVKETDEGVRWIDFSQSKIKPRDDDLAALKELPTLWWLDLSNTQITDQGLHHVSHLPELHFLILDNTQITDEGLARLHNLKRLRSLSLRGTQVTNKGVRRLQEALPQVTVMR